MASSLLGMRLKRWYGRSRQAWQSAADFRPNTQVDQDLFAQNGTLAREALPPGGRGEHSDVRVAPLAVFLRGEEPTRDHYVTELNEATSVRHVGSTRFATRTRGVLTATPTTVAGEFDVGA